MKLTFLGTRGNTRIKNKNHRKDLALFLETNGKVILLDFGSDWKGKLNLFSPDYIWLSSLPSDSPHNGFEGNKISLFCSQESFNSTFSSTLNPERGKFQKIKMGKFQMGNINCEVISLNNAILSPHLCPASGLIMDTDIGAVGYFPKMIHFPQKELQEKIRGLKIYIGDGSFLNNKKDCFSMEDQVKFLKELGIKETIFTNLGKEVLLSDDKEIEEHLKKFSEGIHTQIAHDGLVLEFHNSINEIPIEESLANYLGSKRQFVEKIMKFIPEGTKKLFDPMSGTGSLLIAAAKRGIRIIGNDLSPVPYLYLKGIFEGKKLEDVSIKKLKNAHHITGWLASSGLKRPQNLESKKLIDGLIHNAWKNFTARERNTALAVLSDLLQFYFHSFEAFASQHEPYSESQILKDLDGRIDEINSLIDEVGGKGKIFNRDILNENIPHSDVIYFDPPYFPVGKTNKEYFKHYRIPNSVLMQRDWKIEDPTKENIIDFVKKLSEKTNCLIISATSPSQISWKRLLSPLKKNIKVINLAKISSGAQPQGNRANPFRTQSISELLLIGSDNKILRNSQKTRLDNRSNELLAVKPYKPSGVRNDQLGDDYRIFAGWYSTLKETGNFKYSKREILNDFLIPCLEEILKRKKLTFHPENWKENLKEIYLEAFEKIITKGLPLIEPHAKWIYEKEKTAIVKKKKYDLSDFRILCSTGKNGRGKAYGYIRCEEPTSIDSAQFKGLRHKHKISDEEAQKWWGLPLEIRLSQHRRDRCMECSKPPVYDVLWAEGMAHAWFCEKHFKEWAIKIAESDYSQGYGLDIDALKKITNGEASEKFSDNPNGNIINMLSKLVPKIPKIKKKYAGKKSEEKELEKFVSLYFYPIRDFIPFSKPRSITVLPGTQTAIKKIKYLQKIDFAKITAESIKALNNMDLVMLHAEVHEAWEERGMRKNDELMINLHMLIIEEMARRNMEHRIQDGLDEISIESRGLKIKDKVYLKDWLQLYNKGFYLKDPFMAAIGSIAVSGRGEDADIWINLPIGKNCPVCDKLFGNLEFRLRSFLNENLNNRIKFTPHLVPDPEGKFTNYLEIAKLKVEIIPPEERRFVTMEQKQKIEVGKAFVPLKAKAGAYGTYEFFDKETLWNKWMIKYMKDC